MKKVLIITYYWPPSGGAGVQRWLKLTKYLSQNDVECHVITVDPSKASYTDFDEGLGDEVSPSIKVYKTKSFEPINIFKRIAGEDKVPKSGFSNVNNASFSQKLITALRSALFIPDPRVGWVNYAYSKAIEVIEAHDIDTVITTSPPHSSQLVGLKLKQNKKIKKWIADFRDPWTDIYYYPLLRHNKLSHYINIKKERKVLENADKIITVSSGMVDGFLNKSSRIKGEKFVVIPNGYDPVDFENKSKVPAEKFRIVYTGTMSDIYHPEIFFEALDTVSKEVTIPLQLVIIGSISASIENHLKRLKLEVLFVGNVPHKEVNQYQLDAELLLLVIPQVANSKGILTGKLFEYLATKNRIICIGPEDGDAAEIITSCNQGYTIEHSNKAKMIDILKVEIENCKSLKSPTPIIGNIEKYSRRHQANKIKDLI